MIDQNTTLKYESLYVQYTLLLDIRRITNNLSLELIFVYRPIFDIQKIKYYIDGRKQHE